MIGGWTGTSSPISCAPAGSASAHTTSACRRAGDAARRVCAEFARLWAEHEVHAERTMCTHFDHPEAGPLTLCCEMLAIPDRDQRLIMYTAEPGTPSYVALQRLKPAAG